MDKFIEQGCRNLYDGNGILIKAVAIEQKDFGVIAEVVDLEGESVYRILRAMNSYADMLHALKMLRGVRDWAKEHNKITILQCCDWSLIDAAIAKAERGA